MRRTGLTLLAFLSAAGAASAQTYIVRPLQTRSASGYDTLRIDKAALSGQEIRVWAALLLNADCTPAGTIDAQVIEPPHHGTVRLSDEPFRPNYPPPNPRAACDASPEPGRQAFYTSEPGFHGHDRIALQSATSEGRIRRVVVSVDVR